MKNVTAIIVTYNTWTLLQEAYMSLRRHYPDMPVIIIDNSDLGDRCRINSRTLMSENTTVIVTGRNIGHGGGMVTGIDRVKTEYFLLMDSDVTINCSGVVERMKKYCTAGVYGAGQVLQVDKNGMNTEKGIPYIHPHFALISKSEYLKYDPIINHGAPMIKAMIGFPKLIDVCWGDNITHHERGTRNLNPRGFHPKYWDKV